VEELVVRPAEMADCDRLAELAGQLGYPCSSDEARSRLPGCLGKEDRTVLVAELAGRVVGWAGLEVVDRFYLPRLAELSGLVVDRDCRGRGIGRRLMEAAEAWTLSRGLRRLRLRTNSVRTDAKRFYEGLGFEKSKEQCVYIKSPGS
jgi:GNAT superfamily N-acetyltransferase